MTATRFDGPWAIAPDRSGPILSLVVAMGRNRVIGHEGGLPWRLRDDLKWFKARTIGKPIIMGRKTYEGIGRPLPGRDTIVVSRREGRPIALDGASLRWAPTIADAIEQARARARDRMAAEICVVGGEAIYEQALADIDRIYLTLVDAEPPGDAYFPAFDIADWRSNLVRETPASANNDHHCQYFILTRQRYQR